MKLEDYLQKHGISVVTFADRIGVSRITMYRYIRGERLPKRPILRAIVAETNGAVMPNDFFADILAGQEPTRLAGAGAAAGALPSSAAE